MKKKANPFNIPDQFKRVRDIINRLDFDFPEAVTRGKCLYVTQYIDGHVERQHVFLDVGDKIYVSGLNHRGVEGFHARRFNYAIDVVTLYIRIAFPNLDAEVEAFDDWMTAEENRRNDEMKLVLFKREAEERGYDLVRKVKP